MSTQDLSQRAQAISESVTLAISAKAKALRADGADVIGFGAGEPDFPTPDHVVAAAQAAAAEPAMHKYSPAGGLPALREAIATATGAASGLTVTPDQVVVTNGGKQALYEVFQVLVDPGDEVIVPAPYWVSYPEQVRAAGGEVVAVSAGVEAGYRVTVEQLEAARTPRTKILVFTSPSNPTGAVYPPEQVRAIGEWALAHGIWVVTDEIYEQLVYGDAQHVSMPVEVPDLAQRCIVVNGVAKTYAMTGWRVGWAIAPPPVAAALVRLQSHLSSNVANVSQRAALAAVGGPLDEVARMRAAYDRRRRHAVELLSSIHGVECPLPEGAFYVFPSVRGLLDGGVSVGGTQVTTSLELCAALLESAQVALVPGEGFGAPGHVRVSYALSDDDLDRGLRRVVDALAP